jgi:hypothetical protein
LPMAPSGRNSSAAAASQRAQANILHKLEDGACATACDHCTAALPCQLVLNYLSRVVLAQPPCMLFRCRYGGGCCRQCTRMLAVCAFC